MSAPERISTVFLTVVTIMKPFKCIFPGVKKSLATICEYALRGMVVLATGRTQVSSICLFPEQSS
jgi:hypothetical protein